MAIVINGFEKVNPWYWLRKLSGQNIGWFPCDGAPTNGTTGTGAGILGIGSLVVDINTGLLYANTGTKASPTWTGLGGAVGTTLANGKIVVGNGANVGTAVTPSGDVTITNAGVTAIGANKVLASMLATGVLEYASGTITSANITGTSAGQLGHANGVVLTAAPAANNAHQLVAFGLYYTRTTATYGAGGDLSINWGAGGAALTGVVTAANSVGAAANKAVMLYPLSTAGVPIVSAASLNLVAASAFTNPGTAAGTIAWELWYRNMAVGF